MKVTECVQCEMCKKFIPTQTGEYLILKQLELNSRQRIRKWEVPTTEKTLAGPLTEHRIFCEYSCLNKYFLELVKPFEVD